MRLANFVAVQISKVVGTMHTHYTHTRGDGSELPWREHFEEAAAVAAAPLPAGLVHSPHLLPQTMYESSR